MSIQHKITTRKRGKSVQVIISAKIAGKWKQVKAKSGFSGSRAATQWAEAEWERIHENLPDGDTVEGMTDATLVQIFELFKRDHPGYAYNTISNYEVALKYFSCIKDIPIRTIQYVDIKRCIQDSVIAITTKNLYAGKIKTLLNYAIDEYNIICPFRPSKIKNIPISTNNDDIALTDAELHHVLSYLRKRNTKYYVIACLGAYAGMRYGEIIGLSWQDISFAHSTIRINRQWNLIGKGECDFKSLKRKNSYRTVPLSPALRPVLLAYRGNDNISFGRLFEDKQSVPTRINKAIQRAVHDASTKSLRHTYATNLIRGGANILEVAALIGDTIEVAQKTYTNIQDDVRLSASAKAMEIFK